MFGKNFASRWSVICLICIVTIFGCIAISPGFTIAQEAILDVERQPLEASVNRLAESLEFLGEALSKEQRDRLVSLAAEAEDQKVILELQKLLDPLCLAVVSINPESRVKVAAGQANAILVEKGWRTFLVKVINEGGVTAPLRFTSPQAQPMVRPSSSAADPEMKITPAEAKRRWLDIALPVQEPMVPNLSGLKVEYRVVQLYARDAGAWEATLAFDVGQGSQDLGFRSEVPILFRVQPSQKVTVRIKDHDGKPTTCALLVRDNRGRVYPNPARRLAPDFFFHPQIYRHDGETVTLPAGKYFVTATRGPEYLESAFEFVVPEKEAATDMEVKLNRWIHMAQEQWFSGDHHVHAAGCAHYENPVQGVGPEDMMRHILGEDLNVGCVLSWGPCWYHQKQFFDGKVSKLSRADYLMRYDVEVSGFPSSHAGHLCLLNLVEDDYPKTTRIEEWPSWTIPVLKWGKEQGGVVGYSHSGWGLALPDYMPDGTRGPLPKTWGGGGNRGGRAADKLPDYAMPPFDGIGANEYIVAAPNDACDFISAVDTPAVWELNIWYHVLNCGLRTRISGETDFPCIYGERVGLGRIYVGMDAAKPLTYDDWVKGLLNGRSYVGDGASHIRTFQINDQGLGLSGTTGSISELKLPKASAVEVNTSVAALLPEKQTDSGRAIQERRLDEKPYWHIERARQTGSRKVKVELVINGEAIESQSIEADGKWNDLKWNVEIRESSWVAVRIFPSLHTNPIFVSVGDKPVRASAKSAKWCREAVEVCWKRKQPQIRASEQVEAAAAYDVARTYYDRVISEAERD
jgi:hypothetical protein